MWVSTFLFHPIYRVCVTCEGFGNNDCNNCFLRDLLICLCLFSVVECSFADGI